MNGMNEYVPGEEDLIAAYAHEPGWNGYSEDEADDARRVLAKIKADTWDEAINDARERLLIGAIDQEEMLENNPYR